MALQKGHFEEAGKRLLDYPGQAGSVFLHFRLGSSLEHAAPPAWRTTLCMDTPTSGDVKDLNIMVADMGHLDARQTGRKHTWPDAHFQADRCLTPMASPFFGTSWTALHVVDFFRVLSIS